MSTVRTASALTLATLTALMVGCHTAPLAQSPDTLSYRHRPLPGPSLAFDSPRLQRAQTAVAPAQDLPPGMLPWYAARNDQPLRVDAGIQSSRVDTTATVTVDRQSISGDRVRDHLHITTYRVRTQQTVR